MNRKRISAGILASFLVIGSLPASVYASDAATAASIIGLKTQGRENPIGIDTDMPEFSWQMQSTAVGAAQNSYHITVKDSEGSVVWDSGEVESSASYNIPYEGEPLTPASRYTWSVAVKDENARTTPEVKNISNDINHCKRNYAPSHRLGCERQSENMFDAWYQWFNGESEREQSATICEKRDDPLALRPSGT